MSTYRQRLGAGARTREGSSILAHRALVAFFYAKLAERPEHQRSERRSAERRDDPERLRRERRRRTELRMLGRGDGGDGEGAGLD